MQRGVVSLLEGKAAQFALPAPESTAGIEVFYSRESQPVHELKPGNATRQDEEPTGLHADRHAPSEPTMADSDLTPADLDEASSSRRRAGSPEASAAQLEGSIRPAIEHDQASSPSTGRNSSAGVDTATGVLGPIRPADSSCLAAGQSSAAKPVITGPEEQSALPEPTVAAPSLDAAAAAVSPPTDIVQLNGLHHDDEASMLRSRSQDALPASDVVNEKPGQRSAAAEVSNDLVSGDKLVPESPAAVSPGTLSSFQGTQDAR